MSNQREIICKVSSMSIRELLDLLIENPFFLTDAYYVEIGKAVREKSVFAASRQSGDYEQFLSELVRDWAYTEADARQLSPDRRAWMAVPIFAPKAEVVGVTYLDSNQTGFFTPELQQLIFDACGGIATYVKEVYP